MLNENIHKQLLIKFFIEICYMVRAVKINPEYSTAEGHESATLHFSAFLSAFKRLKPRIPIVIVIYCTAEAHKSA